MASLLGYALVSVSFVGLIVLGTRATNLYAAGRGSSVSYSE